MIIREAEADDATALVDLGVAYFAEAGLAESLGVEFCPQSFISSCEMMSKRGVMLVADQNGSVVGMLGAAFVPALWNYRVLTARECWFFVRPECRRKGKNAGVALLQEFEARATAQGVVISAMVEEQGPGRTTAGLLFKAKAYSPAETVFFKRLSVH